MVRGRTQTAGSSFCRRLAVFAAVVVSLSSAFVVTTTHSQGVLPDRASPSSDLSASQNDVRGHSRSIAATPVAPPERGPSPSAASAISVVRTLFPGFNTSLPGSFVSSVSAWQVGTPTYVPSTNTLWFPQRTVSLPEYPVPSVAPAAVFNLSTGGFDRLVTNLSNASALAYDPGNGYVYATVPSKNCVMVIDPRDGTIVGTAIPVGSAPNALAIDPNSNRVFVANSGSSNLTVIDANLDQVATPGVPVGVDPVALAEDSQDGFVFVANAGSSFITAINATNPTNPSSNISLFDGPASGLAFSPATDMLLATIPSSPYATIIDGRALAPLDALLPVGKGIVPAVTSANGTEFILGNSTGGNLVILNSSVGTPIDLALQVGRNATELVVDPQSGLLYCWTTSFRTLELVDLLTNDATPAGPTVDPQIVSMSFIEGQSQGYAAATNQPVIYSLNPTRLEQATPVLFLTSQPLSVVEDSIADRLYIGTTTGLEVYNASSETFIQNASGLSGNCSQLVLDRPHNLLWLANSIQGVVAVSLTNLAVSIPTGLFVPAGSEQGIAIDPTNAETFVLVAPTAVTVLKSSTGIVIRASVSVGTNVTSLAFDPADDQVYAAGDEVSLLNGTSLGVDGGPISLGGSHRLLGETYEPTRECVYVASVGLIPGKQGTVTVLDGTSVAASEASTIEIPVGESPDAFAVVSSGSDTSFGSAMVWVANAFSGTISLLSTLPQVTYFGANPSTIDLGYPTSIAVRYVGGAGTSVIEYSGLPPGCPSSNEPTLNCTPSATGRFNLTVTVTDALGDTVNAAASLTVAHALSIRTGISVLPLVDVGIPLTVSTTASNGIPPYSYEISFGDGTIVPGPNATHTYVGPGTVVVMTGVRDATGAVANFSVPLTVVARPTVTLSAIPGNVTDVDLPLALGTSVNGGVGTRYENWTFGDGTESSGPNVSHAWTRPGSYTVMFLYVDGLGAVTGASIGVTVHPSLAATFSTGNASSSAPASPGTPVPFRSNVSGGTPPYTLAWSFGDGSNAVGLSLNHSYASAGTYTVKATLTDAVGATVVSYLSVVVAANSSSAGGISSIGGGFASGLFLGVVVGGVLAAVVLFVVGRRKGERPPAGPARPYVPP